MDSILEREGSDLTIVATSVMVLEVKRAAEYLFTNGISVEIIDLHSISHPNKKIREMVRGNEESLGEKELRDNLLKIWDAYHRLSNEDDLLIKTIADKL